MHGKGSRVLGTHVDGLYSTVKKAVFGEAQKTMGGKRVKLLKAAATRWLSHGEAPKRLVSRFSCLIDALDAILDKGADQEVKGVRDELLKPATILFLLLISDVLTHINRFSLFLQRKNLIFADIANKFTSLKSSVNELKDTDGPLFSQHSRTLLQISKERMELARRLRGNNLIEIINEEEINSRIEKFYRVLKVPFLEAVLRELDLAFHLDDRIFLAFDAFNVTSDFDIEKRIRCINVLAEFYGQPQHSTFNNETNVPDPVIDRNQVNDDIVRSFFHRFSGRGKTRRRVT